MRKRIVVAAAVAAVVLAAGWAHWHFSDRGRFTTAPDFAALSRTVTDNVLLSKDDPPGELHFAPEFDYLGGQSFVLYGVADTEQHFFVETRDDGSLKSIYWIQFEAYLPGKPYRYDYDDSPLRIDLGGARFFVDTAVFHNDPERERRRGTDGALVREFLASKGLSYPDEVVYARLVHLTDETRKKELMIIYMDDLADYGATAADLDEGGTDAARWPQVERAHLARLERHLSVDLGRPRNTHPSR